MAMARLSVDDLKGFLKRLEGGEYREFAQQLRRSMDLFLRIERMPKPVIAAGNGVAIAGGLELILCCDMVIAADTALIGDGHLNMVSCRARAVQCGFRASCPSTSPSAFS